MTLLLQKYIDLKCACVDHLERNVNKLDIINTVIKLYAKIIMSRRAVESIDSGFKLIKILEKRDCLSYANVEPLLHIARQIGDNSLTCSIQEYERNLLGNLPEQPSYYSKKPVLLQHVENKVNIDVNSNNLDDLIYQLVAEAIGSSWRVMARHLHIQESTIDNLDTQYRTDITSIVQHVFDMHRRRYPKQWISDVCRALDKSRRSDLKERIEDILHNH